MGYAINAVAKMTGLSAHVLRYYEKEGLLPYIGRDESGFRHYSEDDLEWIGLIQCLKNTGMSIKQIKNFVDLSMQGSQTLKERCRLLEEHKKIVEAQIQEMYRHLEKVTHKIEYFTEQYEKYSGDSAGNLPQPPSAGER
ncbi:MAG: MerR family transcriptional regulator [Oscillospiraceae bacterium]|jgi:DNA-binding transcriptional MerR regulator|nr:MerR family transcriptional regulator [Oscillospiraceae bacterium]